MEGTLIWFSPSNHHDAYGKITAVESDRLYRWGQKSASRDVNTQQVNVLLGVKPQRGSHPARSKNWDGKKEPLFSDALEVIEEMLRTNNSSGRHPDDTKPLLQLQMAYMLLWSGIERFTAFKYGVSLKPEERLRHFSANPVFVGSLSSRVHEERVVYRSDNPEQAVRLRPTDPGKSLDYYYQVRCNVVHRGKDSYEDYRMLRCSLEEMLVIFREVLEAEFGPISPGRKDDGHRL